MAQEDRIVVRSGAHDSYVRFVFDWETGVTYTLDKAQNGSVIIRFSVNSTLDLSQVIKEIDAGNLPFIQRIEALSSTPASAQIYFDTDSRIRDFSAGNKTVIDVYYPKNKRPSVQKAREEKIEKPAEPESRTMQKDNTGKEMAETDSVNSSLPSGKTLQQSLDEAIKLQLKKEGGGPLIQVDGNLPSSTASEKGEKEPTSEDKLTLPQEPEQVVHLNEAGEIEDVHAHFHPHMVSVTATEKVGLAVFQRNDYLYFIVDKEHYNIPPQISGPQYEEFEEIEKFEVLGGTAFRLKLPEHMYAYAEGGGMLWRVILTHNKRRRSPSVYERRSKEEGKKPETLFWPFSKAQSVISFKDPLIGDELTVVTMDRSNQYTAPDLSFIDFDVLNVSVGMAIRSKVDNLEVLLSEEGVTVSRNFGLSLSEEKDVASFSIQQAEKEEKKDHKKDEKKDKVKGTEQKVFNRIFQFDRWAIGGPDSLYENERVLMTGLADKDKEGRVQDILTLAKLNLSNARGSEAAGLLALAADELPQIEDNHEFKAMRGAANAIADKVDLAWPDLADPALDYYSEILFWRAYVLAQVEDWRQAASMLPEELSFLSQYPSPLRFPMTLVLAEIALREGDVDTAEKLLEPLGKEPDLLRDAYRSSWSYLTGEAFRQRHEKEKAKKQWKELINGTDELYRAKASLALTSMEMAEGDITIGEAIDRMERIRYMWRGDELETTVYYNLGKAYIENKNYEKALSVLRSSASQSPNSRVGKKVTKLMTETFRELFLGDKAEDIDPIQAITLYEEFSELTPAGAQGDKLTWKLAERLMEVDLFKRASSLLEQLVDHRLKGREAVEAALKLTAIELIDNRPASALETLEKVETLVLSVDDPAYQKEKRFEHDLFKGRALSQLKRPSEALSLLNLMDQDERTTRLRANIAWQAGRWTDAAEALEELIDIKGVSLTRPPEPEEADMILNWAVALSLSGNRYILSNVRERYSDLMKQTEKAELFEMVTRPRQNVVLADRETISSIVSEVDMFKDFLDNYKK